MKERGEGGESQWRMKEEMESLPPYCFNCESLAFGTQAFTVSLNTDITARLETAHVQRERQRQRHRERQRQRETGGQREADRQTERERERDRNRGTERDRQRDRDRLRDRDKDRQRH